MGSNAAAVNTSFKATERISEQAGRTSEQAHTSAHEEGDEAAGVSDLIDEDHIDHDPEEKPIFAKLVFTKEQQADLRHAFDLLDVAGTGKIPTDDFRVAIKALGYAPSNEELLKMASRVDNGTGMLNFENFETAIMRKVMAPDADPDIMKSFRLFDFNDTGYLDFDDVKRVSEILGTYLTDQEIEEMIDDADKDMDGVVNVQEFMKMIKTSAKIVTP